MTNSSLNWPYILIQLLKYQFKKIPVENERQTVIEGIAECYTFPFTQKEQFFRWEAININELLDMYAHNISPSKSFQSKYNSVIIVATEKK